MEVEVLPKKTLIDANRDGWDAFNSGMGTLHNPDNTTGTAVIGAKKEYDEEGKVIVPGNPKWMVEMLFGQCILEVKKGLDCFTAFLYQKDMKRIDAWRSVYFIALHETNDILRALKERHDATLNQKHRISRKLCHYFILDCCDIHHGMMTAKNVNKSECKTFARLLTQFLEDIHIVMCEDTPKKERTRILTDVVRGRDNEETLPDTWQAASINTWWS